MMPFSAVRCLLLAQGGHHDHRRKCPLLADFVAEARCKLFWSMIPSL
jgi:hypothetical protein